MIEERKKKRKKETNKQKKNLCKAYACQSGQLATFILSKNIQQHLMTTFKLRVVL